MIHHYYAHHSEQHRRKILSQEEMIHRYVSHIPASHFKMFCYYGFLANRKRCSLLPKVYDSLNTIPPCVPEKSSFAALIKGFLNTDPYQCILCRNRLRFMSAKKGTHAVILLSERRDKMSKKDGYKRQPRLSVPIFLIFIIKSYNYTFSWLR
ncbi:transposase [Providencia huaxiensis]|uniref:transposase n=1 Tax=Providencia huaxiensis TaxID=2027290 RepID=UPI0008FB3395